MHGHRFIRGLTVTAVLLGSGALSQCISPVKLDRAKGDRSFIYSWPVPKDQGKLRLAIKDNIDMQGVVTTVGSEYFEKNAAPASRDAECLKQARARGVAIVGKTNLTELALGASGLNDHFGTPRNRLNDEKRLMPGGSSSGSAVAVASDKADVAFGTDTAGSVRTPAACCGIYGLKTTYGLVSLKGVHPLSPKNLDTVGPMARDLPKLVEGMDLLKPGTAGEYARVAAEKPTGRSLRVGRLYIEGTDAAIDEAVDEALRGAGFRVVRLNEAFAKAWDEARKHGQLVAVADSYESDQHLLSERGVTGTTKAALLLGNLEHDTKAYEEALRQRPVWQRLLKQTFARVDFIALPTLKSHPLKIPWWGRIATFEARTLGLQNTVAVNYAGNPALVVPIPVNDKRVAVTSLQLIGPNKSEAKLLNAGRILASKKE